MLTVDLRDLGLAPGARTLDLGCGHGRHAHGLFMTHSGPTLAVDLNTEDVAAARAGSAALVASAPEGARLAFAAADALRLPFEDGAFDAIICSEVLEHLPDYETALGEIARTLRPGGALAVTVPRGWPERICWTLADGYPNSPGGHVRIFKAERLKADIEERGFSFRRRHFAHGLHSPYWWLRCLFWESQDQNWLIAQYKRFLEWDILERPLFTRSLERVAAPLMGKSVALYFTKTAP